MYSKLDGTGDISLPTGGGGAASNAVSSQSIQESMRLLLLVRAYQVNGHSMVGGVFQGLGIRV